MTIHESNRYSRHTALPGFGASAQEALNRASVLVIGAGGLGCPALQYLAAAGIGQLGIVDPDVVSLTNLQRQILYKESDLGQPKSMIAARYVQELNSSIQVQPIQEKITSSNALSRLSSWDIVLDCTDNFPTRYLLCDSTILLQKPLVFGSVYRYEGQVAIFNYQNGPCYRDLHPIPPTPGIVMDCADGGVLGSLCGIIGSIMANETIKLITGMGDTLSGKLLVFDSLSTQSELFTIPHRGASQKIKSLIDYDHFCGTDTVHSIKEITAQELIEWQNTGETFQLIDVREPHEYDQLNLAGLLIPKATIATAVHLISRTDRVVIHCQSGARSLYVIQWLQENHGLTNLYNLKGGIEAWLNEKSN
jgi:sulfur-carrier protein adenylyltransferase/sulfurtransferase